MRKPACIISCEKRSVNNSMRILKFFVFIFIFLNVSLIHALDINCPYSYCGSWSFSIKYPFISQGQKPQVCSHYINLTCTSQTNIVLNTPFSGDFHVVYVNYFARSVTLRDPKNCLAKRLMNLNLSSSPFAVEHYQTITFYNCPVDKLRYLYDFRVVDCLSISPNVTVVSSEFSPADTNKFYGCSKIITKEIPVGGHHDMFGYLELRWNVPSCTDCEEFEPQEPEKTDGFTRKKSIRVALLILIPLGIVVACLAVSYKRVAYQRRHAATRTTTGEAALTRQTTTSSVVQPQLVSVEEMKVPDGQQSYLKTMNFSTFLEWNPGSLEGHDEGYCCTICLEEYDPQDVVRCLTSCHHIYHSKCIDKWFQDNSTCPVCRKSIFDVQCV